MKFAIRLVDQPTRIAELRSAGPLAGIAGERFTGTVSVADQAPIRLVHGGPAVGHLDHTWTDHEGALWGMATIDPDRVNEVRAAVARTQGASIEFHTPRTSAMEARAGLLLRTHNDAHITAVVVGVTDPARTDTRVVGGLGDPAQYPAPEPTRWGRVERASFGTRVKGVGAEYANAAMRGIEYTSGQRTTARL